VAVTASAIIDGGMPTAPPPDAADPVLVRRRQWARFAELGQRAGYGLYALALGLFFLAMAMDLPKGVVDVVVVALVLGSVVLAPAIVVGYGVKAADREDRERGLKPK
jgi:hypothetical protein